MGACICDADPDAGPDVATDTDAQAPDSETEGGAETVVADAELDAGPDGEDATSDVAAAEDVGGPIDDRHTIETEPICRTHRIAELEAPMALAPAGTAGLGLEAVGDRGGTLAGVSWSVIAPAPYISALEANESGTAVSYALAVVGEYRFAARVELEGGAACTTPELVYDVAADPLRQLYLELVWRTDGDANETDAGGDQIYFSTGSDVDVHLLLAGAEVKYFDWTRDCYWDNVTPEWGKPGPDDDPTLVRDDTDGVGPEVIALTALDTASSYTVGVHYWNDWGYGGSRATLRVYSHGALVAEWGDVELVNDDMWEPFSIDAATEGLVTRLYGADGSSPKITPNYRGF